MKLINALSMTEQQFKDLGGNDPELKAQLQQQLLSDALEALKIDPEKWNEASVEEREAIMKKAYRKESLVNHPDRVRHLPEEERKKREELFKEQKAAFDVLDAGKKSPLRIEVRNTKAQESTAVVTRSENNSQIQPYKPQAPKPATPPPNVPMESVSASVKGVEPGEPDPAPLGGAPDLKNNDATEGAEGNYSATAFIQRLLELLKLLLGRKAEPDVVIEYKGPGGVTETQVLGDGTVHLQIDNQPHQGEAHLMLTYPEGALTGEQKALYLTAATKATGLSPQKSVLMIQNGDTELQKSMAKTGAKTLLIEDAKEKPQPSAPPQEQEDSQNKYSASMSID